MATMAIGANNDVNRLRRLKRPLLRGVADGKHIAVWCSACGDWHVHGWTPDETRPSHRVAHCGDGDPARTYEESGYYIAPFSKKDERFVAGTMQGKRIRTVLNP